MKFLVDNALSPEVAEALTAAGHNAVHVRTRALHEAPDEIVLQTALAKGRVLVSADTDFGALLIPARHTRPSLILFRHGSPRRPDEQSKVLLENLPAFADDLKRGAIVVFRHNKSGSEHCPEKTEVRRAISTCSSRRAAVTGSDKTIGRADSVRYAAASSTADASWMNPIRSVAIRPIDGWRWKRPLPTNQNSLSTS